MTNLDPRHLGALHQSAIADSVILARGYRTVTDASELTALGFAPQQANVPGLLLPMWTVDGGNGLYTYRPDNPRCLENKRAGKLPDGTYPQRILKYEFPKGEAMRLDCPPLCQPKLGDPAVPLWVTEGQKKADALASLGLCAIALLGVFNWRGRNENGGATVLADWEYVALRGRDVRLVFDSDAQSNPNVKQALDRLAHVLTNKGARVAVCYLPGGAGGAKLGVDDWLAAGHTLGDLEGLLKLPEPEARAALATFELLDNAPLTLARPLALIDGRAYAATWLYVRRTVTEILDAKQNKVVKLAHPKVETAQELFVIRDDGATFGPGADEPLDDLGLVVKLAEIPQADRLWTAAGVKAYRAGQRPDPAVVFGQMVDVVNRFLDFDRSLAEQNVMAEFCACYSLATWFLDGFNVIGFIWPNGERGSGKTHLLLTVAQLSYLGSVILSGGSFASLRDLADYGATLAFDDAEGLSDPRKSDPDKRALLLAGNRRGATVTIKEPAADGTWKTRHVNAFCPRAFSAIRLPDAVLASRTIIVPLIRTADRLKANADPLDFATWPHDRQKLVNDLWSLALAHLAELPRYDLLVGETAQLAGRNLQPWRAILAVAAWLGDNGVPGLRERMEDLSAAYQGERTELEYGDTTVLLIRAIYAICAIDAVNKETPRHWLVKTAQITEAAHKLIDDEEMDIDKEHLTSRRVGRMIAKMRLATGGRSGGRGARQWKVTQRDLDGWAVSYSLPLPDVLNNAPSNGDPLIINGANGANGDNGATVDPDREVIEL